MITEQHASMDKIVVDRTNLLRQLRSNLAKHEAIYEEALKRYFKRLKAELQGKIEAIDAGSQDVNGLVDLPKPVSYAEQYNVAIKMLEWSTETTWRLSKQEFEQLVLDDWTWKSNFTNVCSGTYGVTQNIVL